MPTISYFDIHRGIERRLCPCQDPESTNATRTERTCAWYFSMNIDSIRGLSRKIIEHFEQKLENDKTQNHAKQPSREPEIQPMIALERRTLKEGEEEEKRLWEMHSPHVKTLDSHRDTLPPYGTEHRREYCNCIASNNRSKWEGDEHQCARTAIKNIETLSRYYEGKLKSVTFEIEMQIFSGAKPEDKENLRYFWEAAFEEQKATYRKHQPYGQALSVHSKAPDHWVREVQKAVVFSTGKRADPAPEKSWLEEVKDAWHGR